MKYTKSSILIPVAIFICLLPSCDENSPEPNEGKRSLIKMSKEPLGDNCNNGGVILYTGLDQNANGILEEKEIENTEYICNGIDGLSADNILIETSGDEAGDHCANGGLKVSMGVDLNNNQKIDDDEQQSETYICNGEDAKSAEKVLVLTSNESPGSNCTSGGLKLIIGYDANQDLALEGDEIVSIDYICNGDGSQSSVGQTYLILAGDITQQQANDKLDKELGTSTQFVWILGTKHVKNVDLSGITGLVQLRIEDNDSLESVIAPDLKTLYGLGESNQALVISGSLKRLDLKNLTEINSFTSTINPDNLDSLSLPSLTLVKEQSLFIDYVNEKSYNIRHIEIPKVTKGIVHIKSSKLSNLILTEGEAKELSLNIDYVDNQANMLEVSLTPQSLGSLSLRAYSSESVNKYGQVGVRDTIHSLKLPNCTFLNELNVLVGELDCPNLLNSGEIFLEGVSTFSCPLLRSGVVQMTNSSLSNLSLANMQRGGLSLYNNKLLTSVALPKLDTVTLLEVYWNTMLSSLELPDKVFTPYHDGLKVNLSGNAFSSVFINNILHLLASLDPAAKNGYFQLSNQNPPAPPSGQGLIDIQTLIDNSNNVNYDGAGS